VIDLRSDTVTKPDERMRAAMAAAEVGDDVLDGDPTMRALEERIAELLGTEGALWVPSGSMGNAIALTLHLRRGDRFLAPRGAHVLGMELGTAAWLSGGMPEALETVTPETVRAAAGVAGPYYALRTSLLCLENTHNAAGGVVTPVAAHRELVAVAREAGLRVHLDGARIWNAAVALGVAPSDLAAGVDTVQVCLSKGLGAPMGSLVAGDAAFVAEGRRVRKMLGGGVRQGGVVAAAGLVALDRIGDLAADHMNALRLAAGLRDLGIAANEPQSNIVLADVPDAAGFLGRLAAAGVLAVPMGTRVRFVTHRDVTAVDMETALAGIARAAKG
jgi:threonine aldolase